MGGYINYHVPDDLLPLDWIDTDVTMSYLKSLTRTLDNDLPQLNSDDNNDSSSDADLTYHYLPCWHRNDLASQNPLTPVGLEFVQGNRHFLWKRKTNKPNTPRTNKVQLRRPKESNQLSIQRQPLALIQLY